MFLLLVFVAVSLLCVPELCSHLTSDERCLGSLGFADVEIQVQGQAVIMNTNVALTVDPATVRPLEYAACVEGRRRRETNSSRWEGRDPDASGLHHDLITPIKGDHWQATVETASEHDEHGSNTYRTPEGETLPATVWVPSTYPSSRQNDARKGGPDAFVHSGYITVIDRRARRKVADGWMEYAELAHFRGWKAIPSSALHPDTVIIRRPFEYKFEFWNERGNSAN